MAIKIDDVKKAFVQGATPDEGDYRDLIELAAVGYKALGNDTVGGKPGAGLEMSSEGKLQVKVGSGITVSADGVGASVDDATVGINTDTKKLEVKRAANSGLESKSDGLQVKTGAGIKVDASGIGVDLAVNGGLGWDNNALKVSYDKSTSGLVIADNKLAVKLATGNNYLTKDANGLSLTADGITKMKDAMASVSSAALTNAVTATESGFKADANTGLVADSVEYKIAAALNTAYEQGWKLTKARDKFQAFLKNQYDGVFKGKTVTGTWPSIVAEFGYEELWIKHPDPTVKPLVFKSDCMKIYRMESNGECKEYPRETEANNPQNWSTGIYLVIGKITDEGKPDKNATQFTEYATLIVRYGTSNVNTIGYLRLSDENIPWREKPLADPSVAYNAYKKGSDSREAELNKLQVEKANLITKIITHVPETHNFTSVKLKGFNIEGSTLIITIKSKAIYNKEPNTPEKYFISVASTGMIYILGSEAPHFVDVPLKLEFVERDPLYIPHTIRQGVDVHIDYGRLYVSPDEKIPFVLVPGRYGPIDYKVEKLGDLIDKLIIEVVA